MLFPRPYVFNLSRMSSFEFEKSISEFCFLENPTVHKSDHISIRFLSVMQSLTFDPLGNDFCALALISQSTREFRSEMKSKRESFLVSLSLLYGVLKIVHFSVYIYTILWVILNEFCEGFCVAEYSELFFIVCTFIPLALLIYGVVKVKLRP